MKHLFVLIATGLCLAVLISATAQDAAESLMQEPAPNGKLRLGKRETHVEELRIFKRASPRRQSQNHEAVMPALRPPPSHR
ncbi:hypothetical protein AAVH_09650 [Aphelenchoides avenae]|nr:hypothetical protein AAVH_09650 [Aphelenchus avenae]